MTQQVSTEMQRLCARLFDDPKRRTVNVKITRGDGPATAEDIAREMNRALDQVEAGTAHVSSTFPDNRPKVDVRAFLAGLT